MTEICVEERLSDKFTVMYPDGIELMFVGIGFITVPIAVIAYTRINRKRDQEAEQSGNISKYTVNELHELGDSSPEFRYTL